MLIATALVTMSGAAFAADAVTFRLNWYLGGLHVPDGQHIAQGGP